MTFTTSKLANGFTVSTDHLPHSNGTTVNWTLRSGSRHEAVPGVAHFVEHAVVGGRAAKDGGEMFSWFNKFCVGMNFGTGQDSIGFYANTGREFAPEVIATIGRAVSGPTWTADIFAREKSRILDEHAKEQRNEFGSLCAIEARTHAYPGHPIGRPVIGTAESIASMREQDLLDYMRDHFHAQRMGLTISGPFTHEAALEMAEAAFGAVPRGTPAPEQAPPAFRGGGHILLPGGDPRKQLALMSFPGFSINSPHEYGAYRMMTLLGNELEENLRKSGSYEYIGTSSSSYADRGTLGIFCETTPGMERTRMTAAWELAARPELWLHEEGFREIQLQKKLNFDFNGNDPRHRATVIDTHFREFGHAVSYEEAVAPQKNVTFADAVKAYAAWDRQTLNIVSCGPSEDVPAPAEFTGARMDKGPASTPKPAARS